MSRFSPIGRDALQSIVDELLRQDPLPECGSYWDPPLPGVLRGSASHVGVSWDLTEDPVGVFLCLRRGDEAELRVTITPEFARDIAVSLLWFAKSVAAQPPVDPDGGDVA